MAFNIDFILYGFLSEDLYPTTLLLLVHKSHVLVLESFSPSVGKHTPFRIVLPVDIDVNFLPFLTSSTVLPSSVLWLHIARVLFSNKQKHAYQRMKIATKSISTVNVKAELETAL